MNCKLIRFRTLNYTLFYTVLDNIPPAVDTFVELPNRGTFRVRKVDYQVLDNYKVHATVLLDRVD